MAIGAKIRHIGFLSIIGITVYFPVVPLLCDRPGEHDSRANSLDISAIAGCGQILAVISATHCHVVFEDTAGSYLGGVVCLGGIPSKEWGRVV